MRIIFFILALGAARPALAVMTCGAHLGVRDLTAEALEAISRVTEFRAAVWEFPMNGNPRIPFILVIGPDSSRKARAIQTLRGLVPRSRAYDLPTRTTLGFEVGLKEFEHAAWVSDVDLHILDVGVPRDFPMHRWSNPDLAATELRSFGFDDHEIMRAAGVYVITP